jgi:hypothetical protein
MNCFLQRHASSVTGMLSGFDRVRFRGTIRLLANDAGLGAVMSFLGVLLKDFKAFAMGLSEELKAASLAMASSADRPVRYLASVHERKEDVARQIAREDGIDRGLICVLTAVEPCWSFHVRRDPKLKKLVLESSWRKCLHLYHYFMHEELGFCHARVQSWLPFNVHVCVNGREWLGRQMDRAGLSYRRRENCFTAVSDPARAQALLDEQLTVDWTAMLDGILRQAHPGNEAMFPRRPMDYYWSADESEWASDVMFKSPAQLSAIYPGLVRHGMQNLSSRDVMRFLGRKDPAGGGYGAFKGEVISDLKQRPEGMRLKHRVNANSIKMYDKQASVLRIETTINNTRDFKVYRAAEGQETQTVRAAMAEPRWPSRDGRAAMAEPPKPKWRPMRKGVSDMHRRAQVCQAANERYLEAMAGALQTTPLKELTGPLCQRVKWKGRPVRGLNPLAESDATLLEHVARGEFILNGFRNRDLRELLFKTPASDPKEAKRRSGRVTRMIRMLRAHGLIHKVPKTHRYLVSPKGRTAITAVISARQADTAKLAKAA